MLQAGEFVVAHLRGSQAGARCEGRARVSAVPRRRVAQIDKCSAHKRASDGSRPHVGFSLRISWHSLRRKLSIPHRRVFWPRLLASPLFPGGGGGGSLLFFAESQSVPILTVRPPYRACQTLDTAGIGPLRSRSMPSRNHRHRDQPARLRCPLAAHVQWGSPVRPPVPSPTTCQRPTNSKSLVGCQSATAAASPFPDTPSLPPPPSFPRGFAPAPARVRLFRSPTCVAARHRSLATPTPRAQYASSCR